MFVTKNRDNSATRPAPRRLPSAVPQARRQPRTDQTDVTNDEWIDWAQPVWWNIRETNTLNTAVAREAAGRTPHLPPATRLHRAVRPAVVEPGETVLSPFAGIGSEVYTAVKLGQRGVGIELKPSYWRTAVDNCTRIEAEVSRRPSSGGDRMSLCILACLMPTDCPRQRIEACPSRSGEAVTLPAR